MLFRGLLVVATVVVAVLLWKTAVFFQNDPETLELSDATRASLSGQFIRIANGVVHYELSGPENGRTIVLVHGFSVPYYLWDVTAPALAQAGYRVLRYDLFGRGFSDRPAASYAGDFYDRQLVDLLDALKITGKADLVGSSMGGPIVATFACRHPERVRTVSLFDPGYSKGGQQLPSKLTTAALGEYTMATAIAPHLPQSQLADFAHPEKFRDWPDRYRVQMRYKGFRRALLATLRNYVTSDWSRDYECIGRAGTPVFLVWGKADRDVPFAVSKDVLAAIPGAQFLPVDDSAHVPFMEHPEVVNPALLNFLAAN